MNCRHTLAAVAAGFLAACCTSCEVDVGVPSTVPTQEQQGVLANDRALEVIDWPIELMKKVPSKGYEVGEWGQTGDGIYCVSVLPSVLESWKWEGATLIRDLAIDLAGPRELVFLPGGRYLGCMSFGKAGGEGPLVLGSFAPETVTRQKAQIHGWTYSRTGISRNRRFVALGLEEDLSHPPADFNRKRRRVRIGMVDVRTLDVRQVGEFPDMSGALSKLAVSNDGEYVAVTYCNNELTVLGNSPQEVLWHQKPNHDNVDHVVFSSDGLTLYGGGTKGLVYAFETKTGKVTAQWCATRTGTPIYGHRIACLAMSPDDRWVAAGTGMEGEVYLFNVTGNAKPRMLVHGLTTVDIVSFSPDSRYLASFAGGKIKIWRVE